jgi:hypothetical protein
LPGFGASIRRGWPAGFTIRDFDVSPGGRGIVVERVRDQSGIVLVDRGRIRDEALDAAPAP